MQIDLAALPDDADVLQSMVRDAVTATLQHDAKVTALTAEIEKLQSLIHKTLRHRFGRRSEQLSPDRVSRAQPAVRHDPGFHAHSPDQPTSWA